MMKHRYRSAHLVSMCAAFGLVAAALSGPATAQSYPSPSRTVRVIVPFLAGSATDVTARLLSERLASYLGVNFVVENRPGAGGNLGTDVVAKADPDGYTLSYSASGPLAINKTLFTKLSYDPEKDLEPISLVAKLPNVLVVNPTKIPVTDVRQFIDYLKAHPAQVNYSSIGNGSSQHLAAVQFEQTTGTSMKHIPYRGAPPIVVDLISGDVPVSFQNIPNVIAPITSGQVRPLALTGKIRSPALPNVPTMEEAGLKGFESYAWFGLLAPKGTPAAIIGRLNQETIKALADPALRQKMIEIGAEPSPTSPAEFRTLIADEVVKWRKLIEEAKIAKID